MSQRGLFDQPEAAESALDHMQQVAHGTKFNEPRFEEIFAGKPITAEQVTEEAIDRVERNAHDEWLAAFRAAIEKVARGHLHFNTDPVWHEFEKEYPPTDQEPRAAGAVVRKAMKDGIIAPTDMYWNSNRKSCHRRPLRVYRSLIFEGELDDGSLAH